MAALRKSLALLGRQLAAAAPRRAVPLGYLPSGAGREAASGTRALGPAARREDLALSGRPAASSWQAAAALVRLAAAGLVLSSARVAECSGSDGEEGEEDGEEEEEEEEEGLFEGEDDGPEPDIEFSHEELGQLGLRPRTFPTVDEGTLAPSARDCSPASLRRTRRKPKMCCYRCPVQALAATRRR